MIISRIIAQFFSQFVLYLCLLAMLIFVRLPLFICHVTRTQASAYIHTLLVHSLSLTHTVAFSFIETGFLGLWAQSIKAMFCGCLCTATAAVFGFNLSLGIFRRRCKVSDEIEILPIAACLNCPLSPSHSLCSLPVFPVCLVHDFVLAILKYKSSGCLYEFMHVCAFFSRL